MAINKITNGIALLQEYMRKGLFGNEASMKVVQEVVTELNKHKPVKGNRTKILGILRKDKLSDTLLKIIQEENLDEDWKILLILFLVQSVPTSGG